MAAGGIPVKNDIVSRAAFAADVSALVRHLHRRGEGDGAWVVQRLSEENATLRDVLRDLANIPAVLDVLGRNHTTNCSCALCRARRITSGE